MNDKTFRVLEYDKIIGMLAEKAQSSQGKKMCLELKPSTSLNEVKERLAETGEGFEIVLKWGSLPLDGIRDLTEILRRAKVGFTLSPGELLSVCDTLRCARRLKNFMKDGTKAELYPILNEIINLLVAIKPLEEAIELAIVSENEISDKASEKLYNLRRSIKAMNGKIRDKLNSMVQTYGKFLQDPIVTLRGDRYVIPVKAECKGSVHGLVHDQSSSGSTLFIEPMAVVELNNELKELMLKEKDEIERILAELSVKVDDNRDYLAVNNQNLAYIDFIMCKSKFGLDFNAIVPEVNERGVINIRGARHPLINRDVVVPIDLRLGESFNALMITGPNTGGKTVTLKTAGLLTLMAMSGLGIPARDGSQVSIFNKVFADIGDEQSIEQSLSTFSSHMTNIVDIIKNVDNRSLVLVDELGAGTDPTEGAALAMALLQHFYNAGARVIGTTHYSEIKVFAMEKEGFENASVEFNVETLRPTYKLLTGIPGKSNAFEISRRLGLKDNIIDVAKEMISKDAAAFEDVIQNLQNKTVQVEKELDEAQVAKREAVEIRKDLSEKKYKLDTQRDKLIKQAQEDAKKIVKRAKEEADYILRELNELRMKAGEAATIKEAEEARKKLKDKLNSMEVKDVDTLEYKDGMQPVESVTIGEELYVTTLGQKAVVVSNIDSKKEVIVQVGMIKINVPLNKLMRDTKKKKEVHKTGAGQISKQKVINVTSSIDLRGQNVDEAMYNLDKYLDDAFLASLEQVTIIHGKGTGMLREGIQQALRKHHHVMSIRTGEFGEGGSGVTIVEIKR